MDFIMSLPFEQSCAIFMFSIIFLTAELSILILIVINAKLFFITKNIKKTIKKARWIGKILFFIFGYFLLILELIPNLIAIIVVGIVSFFQYIANKDISYKKCFMRKFEG